MWRAEILAYFYVVHMSTTFGGTATGVGFWVWLARSTAGANRVDPSALRPPRLAPLELSFSIVFLHDAIQPRPIFQTLIVGAEAFFADTLSSRL
jgi:hypothetical protein